MKARPVISVALLLFVAASIVAFVFKEYGDSASPHAGSTHEAANTNIPSLDEGIVVYYFHGNVRCPTCITLEEYSKEAVETFFADELESGRVQWQVINFDEARFEHYLQDYNLSFQSLVLADVKKGQTVHHTNLLRIWDLAGDKQAYCEYVRSEIDSMLAGER